MSTPEAPGGWPWGPEWLPVERRPLRHQVEHYVAQGYRVVSETPESAQLVRPKRFSLLWFLVWFLFLPPLFGGLIYLGYFASKRDRQVYLSEPGPLTR